MDELRDNPVISTILKRRSIRKYKETPVEKEKLLCILDAMRFAPSGHNSQSWHFVAITNPAVLEDLRVLVRDGFRKISVEGNEHMINAIKASQNDDFCFYYGAPCIIIASNKQEYLNAMADCSCALQNAMLAARAIGLDSCWLNQLHWLDEDADIRGYLSNIGVPPNHTICGAVCVGYGSYDHYPTPWPRKENTWEIIE